MIPRSHRMKAQHRGSKGRRIPGAGSLASQPRLIGGTRPLRDTISNSKAKIPEEQQLRLYSGLHMHTNTHVHTLTHT